MLNCILHLQLQHKIKPVGAVFKVIKSKDTNNYSVAPLAETVAENLIQIIKENNIPVCELYSFFLSHKSQNND